MKIKELITQLQAVIDEGHLSPEANVQFRHSIHEYKGIYSDVDYILSGQKPNTLVLCYDDGMF